MILWLASYPKSGNTWVRALLSNYLNQEKDDDNIFEKMRMIGSFPKKNDFKDIVNENDLKNNYMNLFKYFIPAQEKINKNKKLHIIKTHNFNGAVNGFNFTNKENSIGSIYIVRDPRSVALSYAYHSNISFEKSVRLLLDETRIALNDKYYPEARMSWKIHLKSWLNNPQKKIIIKYEDLKENTEKNFVNILEFINSFIKNKILIDQDKVKKTLEICSFENLSNLEKKVGFSEREKNTNFFRQGKTSEWKENLPKDLIKKIETNFSTEMKDLGYL